MATGCYQDNYLPASFKGIPFEAMEVSSEHGRRGAEGEFPFGESTAYADLGRKIRTFSLSGRLAENSHVADAAAMIAAAESKGSGPLVHPTRGLINVACRSLKVSDDVMEGKGVTTLDFDFVEANDWPSGFSFGGSLFGIDISGILSAASSFLSDNYTPSTVRFYDADMVRDTAVQAVDQINVAYSQNTSTEEQFYRNISDLETIAANPSLLETGAQAYDVISKGMALVSQETPTAGKYERFRGLVNWSTQVSSLPSESGAAQNAIYAAFRTMAAAHMVRAAIETEPETLNAGLAQYDQVASVLDQEADAAQLLGDNTLFLAIRDFTAEAKALLLRRAYELPAIVEYDFGGSTHSLMAAYEIYGDAKRFRDIEKRNNSGLPFMVGPIISAASP